MIPKMKIEIQKAHIQRHKQLIENKPIWLSVRYCSISKQVGLHVYYHYFERFKNEDEEDIQISSIERCMQDCAYTCRTG